MQFLYFIFSQIILRAFIIFLIVENVLGGGFFWREGILPWNLTWKSVDVPHIKTIVSDIFTLRTYENMLSKRLKESELVRSFHAVNYLYLMILMEDFLNVVQQN